jgi:hypothetical protein
MGEPLGGFYAGGKHTFRDTVSIFRCPHILTISGSDTEPHISPEVILWDAMPVGIHDT